jgi:type II secretory pathway predicted ATPase ExeA
MGQYFVIHAARQSGKTTYIRDLTQRLNVGGQYYALYCSLERIQEITEPEKGIPEIVNTVQSALRFSNIPHRDEFAGEANYSNFTGVLNTELTLFCMLLDKPLVILFDEADCLSEGTLISFLRQLRDGYNSRPYQAFPHSVALVGMRNIRDYKAKVRPESPTLGSASPFNIVTKTYTLQNFTRDEIARLYQQHTDETGQIFEEDAIALVWEQTQGQPWLVNAVASEVIVEILQSDYTKPVTAELVNEAIQNIILRRDAHIDSLLERLKEDRVRKVIEPIIMGEIFVGRLSDDFLYVRDLGLITETKAGWWCSTADCQMGG